jgi:hypothetical protein
MLQTKIIFSLEILGIAVNVLIKITTLRKGNKGRA